VKKMKPLNNTPGIIHLKPATEKEMVGQALIDKIEDDYAKYREDCYLRYCKSDPATHEAFKEKLRKAKEAL
jgi:hypothetical protein